MKIALVAESMSMKTGFGNQVRLLARGLRDLDHQITIITNTGVPVDHEPNLQEWRIQNIYDLDAIDREIHRLAPDIIIVFWHTLLVAHLSGLKSGVPNCPVLYWFPWEGTSLPLGAENLMFVPGESVVHLSKFAQNLWGNIFKNTHVIPHMVDLDLFKRITPGTAKNQLRRTLRKKWAKKLRAFITEDTFLVINVDRNIRHKRWDATFDYIRRLKDCDFGDVQLIAHCIPVEPGNSGHLPGFDLPKMAKIYGIEENIIYTNYDWIRGLTNEEMSELYQFADVRISTSEGEGFGIPCWTKNSKVYTKNGIKNIQDVIVGEEVVTHTGTIHKVIQLHKNEVSTQLYHIKSVGMSKSLNLTKEHPMYVLNAGTSVKDVKFALNNLGNRPKWKKAQDISKNDWLTIPKLTIVDTKFELPAYRYTSTKSIGGILRSPYSNSPNADVTYKHVAIESGYSYNNVSRVLGGYNHRVSHECALLIKNAAGRLGWKPKYKGISSILPLDEDLGILFGYYIAEGSISKTYAIEFASNADENKYRKYISNVLLAMGNLTSTEEVSENKARLWTCDKPLSDILGALCGRDAYDKRIPMEYALHNRAFAIGILKGYWWGDGSDDIGYLNFSTCSEILAHQLRRLCLSLGILAYVYLDNRNQYIISISGEQRFKFADLLGLKFSHLIENKRTGQSFYEDDKYFYVRIKEITHSLYKGYVYNLGVDIDNSYCVDGYASHNCIEAGAIACTQIVNKVTNIPELFAESSNALVDPAFLEFDRDALWAVPDVDAMINRTIRFNDYKDEAEKTAFSDYLHVVDNFGSKKIIEQWNKLIQETVSKFNRLKEYTNHKFGHTAGVKRYQAVRDLALAIKLSYPDKTVFEINAQDSKFIELCLELGFKVEASVNDSSVSTTRTNHLIDYENKPAYVGVATDIIDLYKDKQDKTDLLDEISTLYKVLFIRFDHLYTRNTIIEDVEWISSYLESRGMKRRFDMEKLIKDQGLQFFSHEIWESGDDTSYIPSGLVGMKK